MKMTSMNMRSLLSWAIRIPAIAILLTLAACAANHVHPDFEQRISGPVKATGLIVKIESIGLEHGGMKHTPRPPDESVMFMAMRNMQQLFTQERLERMGSPELHLPEELVNFGYEQAEAGRDTKLLADLLASAVSNPQLPARGEALAAVKRLATRTGGDIILLGEIHSRVHVSEESRSTGNLLSILAAAGGQYGVPAGRDTMNSKWVIIDPADGKVLRTLVDTWRI
jgi:hypothetical protein